MNFYLVPLAPTTIGGRTTLAPKYFQTDLAGASFSSIPFGTRSVALLSLAAPNTALATEPDVYAFPADLTTPLVDSDVVALDAYLQNADIPYTWLTPGMSFQDVVHQIAQLFLAAQSDSALAGDALVAASQQFTEPILAGGVI